MTDKIATQYTGFLGRVDAILDTRGHALESQDLPHFNWYQAFVIGQLPADAVNDALRSRPDSLLAAHAAAWWRDTEALDFVERVNDTYAAYIAAGGNDTHYFANWRRLSDAAKEARG